MNLKREYDAALLRIAQSDGERIADIEASRDFLVAEAYRCGLEVGIASGAASRDAEIADLRQQLVDMKAAVAHESDCAESYKAEADELREQVKLLREVILWVKGNVTYSRPMNVRLDEALAATEPKEEGK